MGERRKARESALQLLFQIEFSQGEQEDIIAEYWRERKATAKIKDYANCLVKGVISQQKELDQLIENSSEHWRLSRMAIVDRNVLRIAVYELLFQPDIPHPVVINEAIEIVKKYSSEEAGQFVNGILDTMRKRIKKEVRREK